jgi:hypothetical protein
MHKELKVGLLKAAIKKVGLEGRRLLKITMMEYTVVIHKADEGGYWAGVPALPGCFSQGETLDEVFLNIKEVKMRKVGLDRLDVITTFRRTFADRVMEDPLINSIARAVGEVIEENNKKLLDELASTSKRR